MQALSPRLIISFIRPIPFSLHAACIAQEMGRTTTALTWIHLVRYPQMDAASACRAFSIFPMLSAVERWMTDSTAGQCAEQ